MSILTISREFASGGREIGSGVMERLGYEFLNRELFFREVESWGSRWAKWGKGLDEHSPSIWEKYDWSFQGFAAITRAILLKHAASDNTIMMERGGNFLLKGTLHAFRIRVIAPKEARLERAMQREVLDYDTARLLVERTDHERAEFILSVYGKSWDDPGEFDAIFNTGVQPIEDIIYVVSETLLQHDRLKTEEAQKSLVMRAAAAKLEAGLLTYPQLFISTVEVFVEEDKLVLHGVVRDPKQKKRVEEIALRFADNHPLVSHLNYRV